MAESDSIIAVFAGHTHVEVAVQKLIAAGFETKALSVSGAGYHAAEKVIGFHSAGDQLKIWGERGVFWGGLWGLFSDGVFMTLPVVGHVIVLGYLATLAVAAVEDTVLVGGVSALAAALYGIGLHKDTVIRYETAVKADGFLVMVHGIAEEVARAGTILGLSHPARLDTYAVAKITEPADHLVRANG